MAKSQIEARWIPRDIAVCPICNKSLWIEAIPVMVLDESDRWLPDQVELTCEDEPEKIGSRKWWSWHRRHYSTPYIDWLPISEKILNWLKQPEQQKRVEVIREFEEE